jgi:hypothetical protein
MTMAPAPAIAGRRLPPAPASQGKSVFFASRDACASSSQFSERACDDAFDRVATLIRERAPKFVDKVDCVLEFKMCEADEAGFRPTVLGVEIVRSANGGVSVLPMLAVDTPAYMTREPEPTQERARTGAPSPYGVLALEAASFTPASAPAPSLKGYHQFINEVQLRQAVDRRISRPNLSWRVER